MAHVITNEEIFMPLLNPDEITGDLETVAISDIGDKRVYHYRQEVGGIMNDNEKRRQENPDWDRKSEFKQVAQVPMIIWNLWESMGITNNQKELRRALNRYQAEYMVVEKKL